MPWAWDDTEELRAREEEVEDLRDEEEEDRLAEMPEYAHDRESHSAEVAERVSNECTGGIPGDDVQNSS